jgi:GT2 family glycosyltransferase
MHVSVAIVGFRNPDDIVRCLDALGASSHRDFDVIICENGGPEAYGQLMSVAPASLVGGQKVRVLLAPGNLGYAGGVNACLNATPDADAWWVLNPDTHPAPNAMAALLARLQARDCDAVGCTVLLPAGKVQSHGGVWRPWLARAVSIGYSTPEEMAVRPEDIERTQNYLNGASMLISRRFLEIVGPMREDYFLYCEEVEWCLRGISKGLNLGYAKDAVVLHYQGSTTGSAGSFRKKSRLPIYMSARNAMLLTRDCFPGQMPFAAVSFLFQLVLRYGRRGAWRQLHYGVTGWIAGLANRRGAPAWLQM